MDQKWKKFERVVAAIHMAANSGGSVTWNEHINGRQFDVVIRFTFQFYEYLTLIECRDQGRAIEATDVEAFVTKSRDAGANKAIIVSSSGFQSGAKTVAEMHNIELFTLTEIQGMPEGVLTDSIISVLTVLPVGFWKSGTHEIINLSKNPAQREHEIEENGALMFLVESNQHGQLVQAKAIVPFSDSSDFLELTDKSEIERLRPVLEQFRAMDEKYADTPWAQSWRERNLK